VISLVTFSYAYVSAVGVADVQTIGNNHNSSVVGHRSRVTWVMG